MKTTPLGRMVAFVRDIKNENANGPILDVGPSLINLVLGPTVCSTHP
jgi:hypothetical protein